MRHKLAIFCLKTSIFTFAFGLSFFFTTLAFAATIQTNSTDYSIGDTLIIDVIGICDDVEITLLNLTTNVYINGDACVDNGQFIISLDQNFFDNVGGGNYALLETDATCNVYADLCIAQFPTRPLTTFNFEYTPPAQENIFGSGGLLGTSTNLLASVASGVVDTGYNIWPLFLLIGIVLAFIIAGKVQNFIMEMGAKQRTKYADGEYMANLPNMTDEDKEYYRSNKYKGNDNYAFGILDDDKSEKLENLDNDFIENLQNANEKNDVKKAEDLQADYNRKKDKILKD